MTVTVAAALSCKKEKKFTEPDHILRKWSNATETLNYTEYRKCEAYPKELPVFRELYRDRYLAEVTISKIEDLDEKNVQKDHEDKPYIFRRVYFDCVEVQRSTRRPVNTIRGDVMFIKFIDSTRKNEGWLMSNRTLMKIAEE